MPSPEPVVPFTCLLPITLRSKLKQAAAFRGTTSKELLAEAIRQYLKSKPKKQQKQ